jgi:hypothetical protein
MLKRIHKALGERSPAEYLIVTAMIGIVIAGGVISTRPQIYDTAPLPIGSSGHAR